MVRCEKRSLGHKVIIRIAFKKVIDKTEIFLEYLAPISRGRNWARSTPYRVPS